MVSGGLPRFGTMPTDALCHSSWPSGVAHGKRRRVERKNLNHGAPSTWSRAGKMGIAARMGLLSRHADPEALFEYEEVV